MNWSSQENAQAFSLKIQEVNSVLPAAKLNTET
jgi:hypothetical protein